MKRTEQMFKKASMRWVLSSLFCTDEDKAKLKQEFQVWVGLRFALKKQQNVGMPKKVVE
jgi:hypothetical protein